ncbi:hypothetical protein FIV34_12170 [Luteibacter pinisoli]|uniref:DUF6602 domain-containing protein n=1 Tax=Luteibacter pinisoli TaxID=2589080 RepID=A0A4Y5Z486_9GAMM|nr:DUF6602 domain-containing protein [Luteibacter pinisoli]QDE39914.1 hypothetical protein FIV34_12170 [Luteibacter pinisoli]
MDIEQYFMDLTAESQALKNRIRNLIRDQHWLSDGEWKESVVRAMIRRIIGQDIGVARGFVVSGERASSQIDILLYDASQPVLHRDGDFVVITPNACRGIIEVKTRLTRTRLEEAIDKLADDADFIRASGGNRLDFVGLFDFETEFGMEASEDALRMLAEIARHERARVVDHVVLGRSTFMRFWDKAEDTVRPGHWSLYKLQDMAPGYFLHNLALRLSSVPPGTEEDWFPRNGKQAFRRADVPLGRAPRRASQSPAARRRR